MANNGQTKKGKIFNYIKIGLIILFLAWVVFSINGVQNTAKENKNIVLRPNYDITYVPGGPERFVGGYRDVENVDTEKNVKESNYLWSTVLIKNEGNEDGSDIDITVNAAYPMEKILINPSGYSNPIEVEVDENKLSANINLENIEINNTAHIFVGFKPEGFQQPYDQEDMKVWANSYNQHLQKVNVESTKSENTYFATGYRELFASE